MKKEYISPRVEYFAFDTCASLMDTSMIPVNPGNGGGFDTREQSLTWDEWEEDDWSDK